MTILDYHARTKHSPASVRSSQHFLDWDNQPLPFKIYSGLEPIALPREIAVSDVPALKLVGSAGAAPQAAWTPDRRALARILHLSAGITRRKIYPGGKEMQFRAAACTGALYHIDLYVVNGALPDLDAGVHHFGAHDFSLRRLRNGDYRDVLVQATARDAAVVSAPALLVLTSTFWRNAWKYESRAYRHAFWDSGTILANLLAVTAGLNAPARLLTAFVDRQVDDLLGLDTEREAAVCVVALGHQPDAPTPPAPAPTRLELATEPLSATEVDYPAIRAAHAATSLDSPDRVRQFRSAVSLESMPPPGPIALRPLADPPPKSLDETIVRRGSTRRFARAPISFEQLSTMLAAASSGISADWTSEESEDTLRRAQGERNESFGRQPQTARAELVEARSGPPPLNDVYVIANAVEGVDSGTYVLGRDGRSLEPLRGGDFRREATFLDLGQELAGDAAVNFYLLADLAAIIARFGERGYRAASLEAAIAGGRLYLAAYALGLGATGLTFFDDEVMRFFSPHAGGKGVLFLVAAGHPEKLVAR